MGFLHCYWLQGGHPRAGPGATRQATASLELRHQLDLVAVIKRRAEQGTTMLTVVHELNLAVLLADRAIVLGCGQIEADGPPQQSITDDVLQRVFGVARGRSLSAGWAAIRAAARRSEKRWIRWGLVERRACGHIRLSPTSNQSPACGLEIWERRALFRRLSG